MIRQAVDLVVLVAVAAVVVGLVAGLVELVAVDLVGLAAEEIEVAGDQYSFLEYD